MPQSDTFALQNSAFNPFLFAEIGTELNGSPLTILSTLARLGQDPWAEAAKWARSPKTVAIDGLAQSIARMPLSLQAVADARITATRLVQLLPTPSLGGKPVGNLQSRFPGLPKWVPLAVLGLTLALGLASSVIPISSWFSHAGTSTEPLVRNGHASE